MERVSFGPIEGVPVFHVSIYQQGESRYGTKHPRGFHVPSAALGLPVEGNGLQRVFFNNAVRIFDGSCEDLEEFFWRADLLGFSRDRALTGNTAAYINGYVTTGRQGDPAYIATEIGFSVPRLRLFVQEEIFDLVEKWKGKS